MRRDLDRSGNLGVMDGFDREALRLLTTPAAQAAFELAREDARVRDRYTRTRAGQSLLLARRLAEAGVSMVTVHLSDFRETGFEGGWDDHSGTDIYNRMYRRLPLFDRALAALIEDIYERGQDKRILVVVMGEFGRTPQINTQNGSPGREHWPYAMSVLFAGGGLRVGQVIGSTNSKGEHPRSRPVRCTDVLATLYKVLGIDTTRQFHDHHGRPLAILPEGEPISELF